MDSMTTQRSDLARLGWNEWFEARAQCGPADTLARVVAVDRELLLLMDQTGSFRARLAGSFLHQRHLAEELPCVGDWVCVEKQPRDEVGRIHQLLERKTALRRKSAGETIKHQMIAANVDWVVVVQSCHLDFNLKRLERYLVMVREGGADPCILLTKTDLVAPEMLAAQQVEIRAAGITAPVLTMSNVNRDGLDELKRMLLPAKTYCFVGSSGVGKSTLINHLIGREQLQTGSVSGTGEGRHTTVRRELVVLDSGALVIDNPGMREFGITEADNGFDTGFADIGEFASGCRYRDCSHTGEPGCAVRAALDAAELSQQHYDNFLKLRDESEFYQMSATEKRRKDRDFGKFIKSVKKNLKK